MDAWRYHLLKTAYTPIRSGLPVVGSRYAMISSSVFYVLCLVSTRRGFHTDLVRLCATFLLCYMLQQREA